MATRAIGPEGQADDRQFFLASALAMAAVLVAGFSLNIVMGRSSFGAPTLVHAHALVFFGWVVLYVVQNLLVARGSYALHRQLGWIGAFWVVAMIVLGCLATLAMVRRGGVPFFFLPQQFLVFDPATLFGFAALTYAAIALRRHSDWHRRLNFCAMTLLLGPGFGRLLPMPLLTPYAFEAAFFAGLIFPAAGMVADIRRTGRIHPAWHWGLGAILLTAVAIELVTFSPLGDALYRAATMGSMGESVAPLAYPAPPAG
ncbi:hypothetical protein [Sphingomonas sp.]|uniref:hypothetical protein n=1 Tax=Sphingomonas sp. TaxID=28214 RepID=UPI001DB4712B|nr:hypothetical protein [Sphingomonas sp.]MBX9797793.1 hypothetical protein [Sphingomonas sp.]